MKIRIEGNSVRLRLRRSEVTRLGREGMVSESARLPGGEFHYSLVLDPDVELLQPSRTADGIRIALSRKLGLEWAASEQVGFEAHWEENGEEPLHLLVEKDFVCMDRDPGTQQDQYPNPKAGAS